MIASNKIWKIVRRLLKISIFIGIFLVIIFTILSSLGGNGDTFKDTIESLVEERYPEHDVQIDTLNHMRFFPYLGFDIEDIKVVHTQSQNVVATADKIQAAMRFWDVAFGTGKISSLHIQNFGLKAGLIHPQILLIEQVAILKHGDDAFFEGQGRLGEQRFSFSMPMTISGSENDERFSFPTERSFKAQIDDVKLSGILSHQDDKSARIEQMKIMRGELILDGDLAVKSDGKMNVSGILNDKSGHAVSLNFDIKGNENISGSVRIENEAGVTEIQNILNVLTQFWFGKNTDAFVDFAVEVE